MCANVYFSYSSAESVWILGDGLSLLWVWYDLCEDGGIGDEEEEEEEGDGEGLSRVVE